MKAKEIYGITNTMGGIEDYLEELWEVLKLSDEYKPKNSDVLNIGSGCGRSSIFLKNLDLKNRIVLVDVCKDAFKLYEDFKSNAIIENYYEFDASLDDVSEEEKKKYDFVFMFETLEHVSSPYQAILNAKTFCKDNGYIHISIPDYEQQKGYGSHFHSFVYPGLFKPEYFDIFLNQMYLSIEVKSEFRLESTYTYSIKFNGKKKKEIPLHHYYVCKNLHLERDIMDITINNDYDIEMLYNF